VFVLGLLSIAVGFLARSMVSGHESFWIISPVLYVARHDRVVSGGPVAQVATAAALFVGLVALWIVPKGAPGRAVFAIQAFLVSAMGCGLSNVIEVVLRGKVTDFFGVHLPNGAVYSAGDLAITVGISMIPVAAFALPDRDALAPWLGAATGYLAVAFLGFVMPGQILLVIGATAVGGLATAGLLLGRLRSPRRPSPTTADTSSPQSLERFGDEL